MGLIFDIAKATFGVPLTVLYVLGFDYLLNKGIYFPVVLLSKINFAVVFLFFVTGA